MINGFAADVVALSLAPDLDAVVDAGLITHDWTEAPDEGTVSTSLVVFDVRPGNPQGIRDFDDLTRSGLEIFTPDPASSGGAPAGTSSPPTAPPCGATPAARRATTRSLRTSCRASSPTSP